jgi:hypothetical protein
MTHLNFKEKEIKPRAIRKRGNTECKSYLKTAMSQQSTIQKAFLELLGQGFHQ